jgi:transposase-like protein
MGNDTFDFALPGMSTISQLEQLKQLVVLFCKVRIKIVKYSDDRERNDGMKLDLSCPTCGSDDIIKNGRTRRGKLSP